MKADRRPLATINITPFVDVLLILLVVVMLAMPMFVKRLPVELPQTELAGAPILVKTLPVSLLASGTLMSEDSLMTLQDIERRVTPETTIELSVDRDVRYEDITKLIVGLQKMNPRDIALVTR